MRESSDGDLFLHTADEVREKITDMGVLTTDVQCTEVEEADLSNPDPGGRPWVSQVSVGERFAFFVEGESEEQVQAVLTEVGIEPQGEGLDEEEGDE